MAKKWYRVRTWKDAPSDLADPAETVYSAWARGWNDAVEAWYAEFRDIMAKERGDA